MTTMRPRPRWKLRAAVAAWLLAAVILDRYASGFGQALADWFTVAGAIGATLFVIDYTSAGLWRENSVGRGIVYRSTALAAGLWLVVIGNFVPDLAGRDLLRLMVWPMIAYTVCWLAYVFALQRHLGDGVDDVPPGEPFTRWRARRHPTRKV